MSKKHIFSLPDDVLTSLFVEWSHVHNISLFDSACCNKTDRIIFLNLLKHKCAAPFGVGKDFLRRVEFQERGTPHSHYLINIELIPGDM
jgi:hypothetical protein